MKNQKRYGQWYTIGNPFQNPPFKKWLAEVAKNQLLICEPFCGAGHLVSWLPEINWGGYYDIHPPRDTYRPVILRNTLRDFPAFSEDGQKFEAVITNPPWFSRNQATRRGIQYIGNRNYDDLYKEALSVCLENVGWVAALVPESFINARLFLDRLATVVRFRHSIFSSEIEHPTCLALFSPKKITDVEIWDEGFFVGYLNALRHDADIMLHEQIVVKFCFNNPAGQIFLRGIDSRSGPTIRFRLSNDSDRISAARNSRHNVLVKIPDTIPPHLFQAIIENANCILEIYRLQTHDLFLAPTKSYMADGRARRRLDWETASRILRLAILKVNGNPYLG